ncbi:MAG: potassium channel family protein, partial [Phycisphaerae bacterium]
ETSDRARAGERDSHESSAAAFWEEARRQVDRGDCDFSGRVFPEDPTERGFQRVVFTKVACFRKCRFQGTAVFYGAEFREDATFESAQFEDDARFGGAFFRGSANFWQARFQKDANFRYTEFSGTANFFRAIFEASTYFYRARFLEDCEFEEARFAGQVDFQDAVSGQVFTLDLPRGGWFTRRIPFARRGQGHHAYRLAKQSATDRGDYQLAGKCHYAEQSTRCTARLLSGIRRMASPVSVSGGRSENRLAAGWRSRFQGLRGMLSATGEWIFARWLFGYGERIRGILLAAVLVIVGWAAAYSFHGIVSGEASDGSAVLECGMGNCLYFSVVTFTTLGYGDLRPSDPIRALAAGEAVLGAFLMALFVVAMARKFTR